MSVKSSSTVVGVMFLAMLLGSCSTPQESGFLGEFKELQEEKFLPIDLIWVDKEAEWKRFDKVLVAPVNTEYLAKMSFWDKATFAGDVKDDAVKVGAYMQKAMVDAIKEREDNRYAVVEATDDTTMVLELALTEIIPTKAWLNAATLIFVGAWSKGTVAMEGRIRDPKTDKIIAKFADRRNGKLSPPGIQDLTWFWHAEQIIDDWADEFAEVINVEWGTEISGITWFTLKPW